MGGLFVVGNPAPANKTTDIVAKDAFIEAMQDKELALKVREREPRTIDEAYRVALRLAAYQHASDVDDRRRPHRVGGARGEEPTDELPSQLEKFMEGQRRWQRQRLQRQLEDLRREPPR